MRTTSRGPTAPKIDEAFLRRSADASSFERGLRCFTGGCVGELLVRADSISAVVQQKEAYKVGLWREQDSFAHECDCPQGLDGAFCSHCVAVGLAWIAAGKVCGTGSKTKAKPQAKVSPVEKYLQEQEPAVLVAMLLERAAADRLFAQCLKMQMARQKAGHQSHQAVVNAFSKLLDKAIKRRGFVAYGKMRSYALQIESAAKNVRGLLDEGHPKAVRELAEYGLELLEEAGGNVDDSNGFIQDLALTFQRLHHAACKAAPPDPLELAEMLFEQQIGAYGEAFKDASETYAELLGDTGMAAYTECVQAAWESLPALTTGSSSSRFYDPRRWRITKLMEHLLKASGDIEAIVAFKAKDLSSSNDYLSIVQTYSAAGQHEKALAWAERGRQASPRADDRLNKFLTETYQQRGQHKEAIAIAWEAFCAWPCSVSYKELKCCVNSTGEWPAWRQQAIDWVRGEGQKKKSSIEGYRVSSILVDIYLDEDDVEAAWQVAIGGTCYETQWLQLAERRAASHPLDSIGVYQRLLNAAINVPRYAEVVHLLRKIQEITTANGKQEVFKAFIENLRLQHKLKRSLMGMLQDAGW